MTTLSQRCVILIALLTICLSARSQDTAQIVAPSVISSENPEFGAALTPNGKTFFFNRTTPDRRKMFLMVSQKRKKQWQAPTLASFTDTTFREIDAFISPDGKRLFFSSTRPTEAGAKEKDFDVWMSQKKGQVWQTPIRLSDAINSNVDEVFVSTSRSGNMYFARFVGNKSQLFMSKWANKAYQKAERIALFTDTASISNPAISPDETMLVFVSGQLGGQGGADLFLCRKEANGQWSKPLNVPAPINSPDTDFAPSFSADGKSFYWTSERRGVVQDFPKGQRRPGDIYKISVSVLRTLF